MEMWLKRLTLVLLTAALVISDQDVILDQTQRKVEVSSGSSVNFVCCMMTGKHERYRVVWHFNRNGSSFEGSHNLKKEVTNKTTWNNGTKYPLPNATDKDSGWYFCKVIVEIPLHSEKISNGTQVVIKKSKEHPTYPSLSIVTDKQATKSPTGSNPLSDQWLWIGVGVSSFILIVLLVICVLLRRRTRRRTGDSPIYANTRPVTCRQPSPRPGVPVDNLKMVSSSQNLRNSSPGRRSHEDTRRHK